MKMKALLVALFAAGVAASLALADEGHGHGCVRLEGAVAPQTLTLTVAHAAPSGTFTTGSAVTVTIGGAGQTVAAEVSGCSSGTTGGLTVDRVDLRVAEQHGGDDGDDDSQGDTEHHHGTTTTTEETTTGD
jgi:hypothetical protein